MSQHGLGDRHPVVVDGQHDIQFLTVNGSHKGIDCGCGRAVRIAHLSEVNQSYALTVVAGGERV